MAEEEVSPAKKTLAQAMSGVFHPRQSVTSFAQELTGLTVAITSAPEALVLAPETGEILAATPIGTTISTQLVQEILAGVSPEIEPGQAQDALFVPIALPGGDQAILVNRLRSVGGAVRALAFERLVSLAHLSVATYRHSSVKEFEEMLALISQEPLELEVLASRLRTYVDADMVGIATYLDDSPQETALSDQPKATRRATLPEDMVTGFRAALAGTAVDAPGLHIARNGNWATVINAKNARQNQSVLPFLAQAAASRRTGESHRRLKRRKGFVKYAALVLLAVGICFVPLPDARRVPAEVIATTARTVTAPLTGVILSVSVSDGDAVQAGETEIAQLATNEIAQELAGAQAEYSRALLERESARGARDAAALRNAELEAETLRARIDLLEDRRLSAEILAPIDGVVVGDALDTLVGATVRQGDVLLDVVDPGALMLRLEVPDDLLYRIEDGELGLFRPDFAPDASYEGAVQNISPAQSTRTDIAVFEGRASLPADTGQLRPGLRGVFIFERDYRFLGQIVYDALRNWVLLRVWL